MADGNNNSDEKQIFNQVKQNLSTQDSKQKIGIFFGFILQIYRVIVGSFLSVFVPQSCDGSLCTMSQNIMASGIYNIFVLYFNLFTFLSFCIMYYFEIKRENRMIVYLDVNNNLPSNDAAVEQQLKKIPEEKLNKLYYLDKRYWQLGVASTVCFILNLIFSTILVLTKYLDNNTIVVLLTNVLFISTKLYTSYEVINTSKNIFLSSYLTKKIQFNDVDPDKVIQEEIRV
jgi:hypothetical protein